MTNAGRLRIKARLESILLVLLIVLFCTINTGWILRDRAPMANTDAYIYLHRLLSFSGQLGWSTLLDWRSALAELSHAGRPPLYQLLTVPFVFILGRSEDALLSVNTLFLILLMVSTYNIGRLAGSRHSGVLAALFVVSYSPIVQLSRMYMPHFAMISSYALSAWMMLRLAQDRTVKNAWLFSGALAFTSLIHPNFFWILAPAAVLFSVYVVFCYSAPRTPDGFADLLPWIAKKLRTPFALYGLIPGGLVASGIALCWYLNWGMPLLEAQRQFFSAALTEFRGFTAQRFGFTEVPAGFWWYVRTAPGTMSNILAAGALAGLVFGVWRMQRTTLLLAGLLVTGYVTQSQQANLFWMYIAPILAVAAALTAVWLTHLRPRWLSATLSVLCILTAFFNIAIQTWGIQTWSRPIAVALGSPVETPTCAHRVATALCPTPVRPAWPISEILETVLSDPECTQRKCTLLVVNYSPFFRGNFVFEMLSKWGRLPVAITSHGVARLGRSYPLKALLKSDYLTWVDVATARNPLSYRTATTRLLRSPPPTFADSHTAVASFEVVTGDTIKLIKRTAELTAREASESLEALELHDRFKTQGHEFLDSLDAAKGDAKTVAALSSKGRLRSSDRRARSRALLEEGQLYAQQKAYESAIEVFERGIGLAPESGALHFNLGLAYRAQGRLEDAIEELETTIVLSPDNPLPRKHLADILTGVGKTERAVELYQQILTSHPEYVAARIGFARTCLRLNRVDEAISHLNAAIALEPDHPQARRLLATIRRRQSADQPVP